MLTDINAETIVKNNTSSEFLAGGRNNNIRFANGSTWGGIGYSTGLLIFSNHFKFIKHLLVVTISTLFLLFWYHGFKSLQIFSKFLSPGYVELVLQAPFFSSKHQRFSTSFAVLSLLLSTSLSSQCAPIAARSNMDEKNIKCCILLLLQRKVVYKHKKHNLIIEFEKMLSKFL